MALPKSAECSDCLAYGPVAWYVAAPSMVALCRRCERRMAAWCREHGMKKIQSLQAR